MSEATYKVILLGVAQGFDLQDVKEKLAAFFKIKPAKVDAFFKGKPVVVKKGLDNETALKYKSVFELAGATCRIEALEEEDDIPSHMIEEASDAEEEDGIPSHMIEKVSDAEEEDDIPSHMIEEVSDGSEEGARETMVCPKCGFEQEQSVTCVQCGIIVEKYLKMKEEEEFREEGRKKVVLEIEKQFMRDVAEVEESVSTSGKEIFGNILGSNYPKIGVGVVALFFAFMVFEVLFLKGDLITSGSVHINDEFDYVEVWVDEPWTSYLVEVSTVKNKLKLNFRVEDQVGRDVYDDTENSSHNGMRIFSFEAMEEGTHRIYVNPGAILTFGEGGYADVNVYVNDHRMLTRIFTWFNF